MNVNTMNVLVVDDSKTMIRIISNTLRRIGIENIHQGLDGLEGLELFKKNKFDIVMTDWNMPNMNGLELVQAIRKLDTEVPIIMVTTEGGKREVIKALKAGVNSYLIKPFTPEILRGKLKDIIF